MHEKILERINQLGARQEAVDVDERIVLSGRKYQSFGISIKNFNKIDDSEFDCKIGFIDGGNSEILKAVNYSLQMIRVVGLIYENEKKVEMIKKEFYVLVYASGEDIKYKVEIYPLKGSIDLGYLEFNSMDRNLMNGNERASISKIGGVIRRIAEIKLAKEIDSDIVVLDGSLQTNLDLEKREMYKLFDCGKVVCGLCKTSRIFTDKGNSLLSVLAKFGYKDAWYYDNLADINDDNYKADIFGVKLNSLSKHIFLFEIFKNKNKGLFKVLSMLKKQSNDLVFPGYPYGLIEADKFARISEREKEYLFTRFKAIIGQTWETIEKDLNSLNSHDKLDNIS